MRWLKTGLLAVGLLLVLTMPSVILAGTSADVTVTATGYIVSAPSNLTLIYISDYEVGISWTKGPDAENTMVRAAWGHEPTSRTDGYLVYYGDQESCIHWTSLETATEEIHYKAWSQNAGGLWEEQGVSDLIRGGAGMTLIALFAFCGIVSFLSMRSKFMLLKLLAGAAWIALFVFWMASPPVIVEKGTPPHIAVMIVIIGLAVAIPLVGLGREIETQKDWRSGLNTETSGAFHFNLPNWLRGSETVNTEKRRQNVSEYRNRLHNVLNPPRRTEK